MLSTKRMMGIEPTSKAWEAFILPMNYIRMENRYAIKSKVSKKWTWSMQRLGKDTTLQIAKAIQNEMPSFGFDFLSLVYAHSLEK